MNPMLGCLAIHAALATAAAAPARAVPPTGHYVYLLSPSVRIQEVDTPAKELHKAAAVFWGGNHPISAMLAANGIADESRLKFGTVLRVPPPSQASAMNRSFELGLRLEVGMKGHHTVRVGCDPCNTPEDHDDLGEPVLALLMTDDRGRAQHVRLEPIPDAEGGAGYTGGAVTDLRAWDLPDGDVLLVARSRDATDSAGWGVAGGIAFYRLSAGPRAALLASLSGDRGRSGGGGSSHDDCSLSAALEAGSFVLTVARMHYDFGADRRLDQSIVRYSSEAESRQRLTYDAASHTLNVGSMVEVARRHKRWAEGEPEPAAFTEDPVQH
jgi:hypothetical protein